MPLKHLAHYVKLSLRMLICPLPPKGLYIKPVCCWCCSMEESVGFLWKNTKRLNTFHHRCIRTILGITCTQQWEEHISSRMMREQWGDEETITTKLMRRHLEWLGHLARMSPERISKITDVKCSVCGWCFKRELDKEWPSAVWCKVQCVWPVLQEGVRQGMAQVQCDVKCSVCGRCFRRESDKAIVHCRAPKASIGAGRCSRMWCVVAG